MKRLTYEEPSGIWGVHGEEIADMSDTMYAVAERLLEYEETGLTPDDIRTMQAELTVQGESEPVHIGQVISSYRIIGMFNGCCIAQSVETSDNYVVWTIDADGCGVRAGRYRTGIEKAVEAFVEVACNTVRSRNEEHPLYQLYDLYECYDEIGCYHTLEEARLAADKWKEKTDGECDLVIRRWDEWLRAYVACGNYE